MPSRPTDRAAHAFDQVAGRYDAESTYVELSVWFRALTWQRMERLFQPGMHLLELGCGTGEDALWHARRGVHVTAVDASPAMLDQTARKVAAAGLSSQVTVYHFDFNDSTTWNLPGVFDGVYSNYGALNCTDHFAALGRWLAERVRPGGMAGLCVIGRTCLFEMAWHMARLRPRRAFRRLSGHAMAHLEGNTFPVWYPMPGALARAFGPAWQRTRLDGLGVFLPPSDLYQRIGGRPRLARTLLRLERAFAPRWPFRQLGDHYWLELRRTE